VKREDDTMAADRGPEYYAEAMRRSRARKKAALQEGKPLGQTDDLREILADAALIVLAAGGEGSRQILGALQMAYRERPGLLLNAAGKARAAAAALAIAERELAAELVRPTDLVNKERWLKRRQRKLAEAKRDPWAPRILTPSRLRPA